MSCWPSLYLLAVSVCLVDSVVDTYVAVFILNVFFFIRVYECLCVLLTQ